MLGKKVIQPKWCDGYILSTDLANILVEAIETENEHRLGYGSIGDIFTDDESDEELEFETDSDSD